VKIPLASGQRLKKYGPKRSSAINDESEREIAMKKHACDVCAYIYEPEAGDQNGGIAPGTAWEDLPEDWICPICGADKSKFSPA